MSITDNISITHFSFGVTSMLVLFILLGLMRYFKLKKKDDTHHDGIINIPIPDPTVLANNLPPII